MRGGISDLTSTVSRVLSSKSLLVMETSGAAGIEDILSGAPARSLPFDLCSAVKLTCPTAVVG